MQVLHGDSDGAVIHGSYCAENSLWNIVEILL